MIHPIRLLCTSLLLLLLAPAGCDSNPLAASEAADNALLMEKLANRRVLWVAPHADDELIMAPVLGEACVHRGASCTLLLVTDNTGWCPFGPCRNAPDTIALRMAEHRDAVSILDAEPAYLEPLLPATNRPQGRTSTVRDAWREAAGGDEALIERFQRAIADVQPEVVLTFDPRHGSTCHPEHRVTAQLVLEALRRSGSNAEVLLAATSLKSEHTRNQGILAPAPFLRETGLLTYDASRPLTDELTGWRYLAWVMAAYPSQFTGERQTAVALVRPEAQRIFVIPAANTGDLSQALCSNG